MGRETFGNPESILRKAKEICMEEIKRIEGSVNIVEKVNEIIDYLNSKQAAKCSEPSKCEFIHQGYSCSCGWVNPKMPKPSDSGSEKEVEELAEILYFTRDSEDPEKTQFCHLERWVRDMYYLEAKRLIKIGYSKQPKSNNLVALDRSKMWEIFKPAESLKCPTTAYELDNLINNIFNLICSKFGKPKVLSVEEIYNELRNCDVQYEKDCIDWDKTDMVSAKAIHAALEQAQ